jgi:hypothetical protein
MSEHRMQDDLPDSVPGSRAARMIRRLAVPVAVLWVAIAAACAGGEPMAERTAWRICSTHRLWKRVRQEARQERQGRSTGA